MANIDRPRGLAPLSPILRVRKYKANTTTDIYRGDVVQFAATGKIDSITTTTGANTIIGVAANRVDASASATAQDCWVYDHPSQEFTIQDDGAAGTPAQADIGATAVLVLTTGNSTSGQSKVELDISGLGAAATDPLMLLGFITGGGLEIAKFATYRVSLNRHQYSAASAGI